MKLYHYMYLDAITISLNLTLNNGTQVKSKKSLIAIEKNTKYISNNDTSKFNMTWHNSIQHYHLIIDLSKYKDITHNITNTMMTEK